MLLWSARLLAFYKPDAIKEAIGWTVHNALLNTFSIHARNLVQFLYPNKSKKERKPTDVSIDDYLNEDTLSEIRPPLSTLLSEVNTKTNRQVAHITTDRIVYELQGKGWNFLQIAAEIIKVFSEITPFIPSGKMSKEIKNRFSKEIVESPIINIDLLKDKNNIPNGLEIKIISKIEVYKTDINY